MKHGIDKYIGIWVNDEGFRLEITKIDKTKALVSMFSPNDQPISRAYWNDKKTINMPAKYDDYYGEFDVQLWKPERDFCLNLLNILSDFHDNSFETLTPALTRNEEDHFLDSHYNLFGKLSSYKKVNIEINKNTEPNAQL